MRASSFSSSTLITTLFMSITAFAAEKPIQRDALPPAVQKAVEQQSQGATIKGFTTETEHGKRLYEAQMIVDGHTRDVEIAADGTVNEVEEEVAMNSLPESVQSSLTKRAAGANITKVESLTKQGKLVAYEAATLKGSRKGEIQVGPDGNRLTHEE